MEKTHALRLLRLALDEIQGQNGEALTDRFSGLREVDAKIREVRQILAGINDLPDGFVSDMDGNLDFQVNSRRVRLEALAGYVRTAIKFVDTGAFEKPKKLIHPPPDYSRLTISIPGLKEELDRRWREAQKCVHVGAYTSAVIMMGSILEGLLLARAQASASTAHLSARAPKDKSGKSLGIQHWTLSALIDVATDVGWIKTDRGKFSHALRDSRNVVHPWQAVTTQASFDAATCTTSWHVLSSSVDDLLVSLP